MHNKVIYIYDTSSPLNALMHSKSCRVGGPAGAGFQCSSAQKYHDVTILGSGYPFNDIFLSEKSCFSVSLPMPVALSTATLELRLLWMRSQSEMKIRTVAEQNMTP